MAPIPHYNKWLFHLIQTADCARYMDMVGQHTAVLSFLRKKK